MSVYDRPLYDALPGLQVRLPGTGLAALPTPLECHDFDGRTIWVKRDDLSNPIYGGNKVRKLEFILAAAMASGRRRLVTFGATGTHHGLACAIFCRQTGLECELLLFDQPDSPHVRANLRRLHEEGARCVHCHGLGRTLLRYYLHPGRLGSDTAFLFAGGSNELGVLAFINAALELKAQLQNAGGDWPRRIYCPLGSGSTLAGLTLGVALAELPIDVIGVRVADAYLGPFPACTAGTVSTLMKKTLRWLRRRGVNWPAAVPSPQLDERWIGRGYGHPSDVAAAAASRFQQVVGVPLDMTYTAKAFAAVLAEQAEVPVLYWHTLSSAG